MRARDYLDYYSRVYPEAWKQVDSMRADRGRALPWWPEWCFMPLSGTYAIVSHKAEKEGIISDMNGPVPTKLIDDVGVLGALAAWRVTQGVYRFDQDVYDSVINTPTTGDIPHDVFFELPEWCIYIETPGMMFDNLPLYGYFAHLEYDAGNGRKELRLVLDVDVNDKPYLVPRPLHLGEWSLEESINKAMEESQRNAGVKIPADVLSEYIANESEHLRSLISLLLYICSANGEIGSGDKRPTKPRSVKTKKGSRLFPPDKPRTWDVGVRTGAAIRHAQSASRETTGSGASTRTHIRRAHWHGYWSGPRNAENRKYELKWLPPMIINPSEELPITIRPIK